MDDIKRGIERMVAFIFFLYVCFIVWLIWGLSKKKSGTEATVLPYVSVVIAFRNESINLVRIFDCLEKQKFPMERFEIIFVNDHSSDNGEFLLKERILLSNLNSRIVALTDRTGKKSAIELGLTEANNDIIVTVDADCRMNQYWLAAMTKRFKSEEVSMVLGPIILEGKQGVFDHIQVTEFSTLMGMTMATANNGRPILSNGANCAFRRREFLENNPYSENRKVETGDDIFLLHSLKKAARTEIEFCNELDALVKTSTKTTLSSFLSQRLRWASKTKNYKDIDTLWMGALLFAINLSVLIVFINMLLRNIPFEKLGLIFLFKWILDLLFLQRVPIWLRPDKIIFSSFFLSIVYPFYSVGIALLSLFYKPNWKGRKI
ncbi:MAG: glycosyltransferase [Flavobacteriales bacterium]|nr:glycosyltransferase [Flavobacteriales bacterium]